uniref:Uncharacterized protein n=1 Tax=Triticum urartu TaxID=4572 RepID=A0A8R7UDW3_TRIUA
MLLYNALASLNSCSNCFTFSNRDRAGLDWVFGVLFSFLRILMLFDKGFLAMGNVLFVSGVSLTIGLKSTFQFFTKPKNRKDCPSFSWIKVFLLSANETYLMYLWYDKRRD